MPKPVTNAGLRWRYPTGLSPEQDRIFCGRLEKILESWRDTPYMIGQQCKGVGADCVRFVCAVLDELFRLTPREIKTLPDDACLHSRAGAISGMRKIRELYMPNDPVEDGAIEPGDVIVTGPSGGGPGHAMIVGPSRNALWHAAGEKVHQTGLGFAGEVSVFRVYRMRDRSVAC